MHIYREEDIPGTSTRVRVMLARFLWYCYQLSRTQWFKPPELRKLQRKRLRAVLKHAYENVPLYHEKFDSVGAKPSDVKTVEDLSKLPFTTKQEVWKGIPSQSIARGYDLDSCVRVSTSGTSGGPMPVYQDKRFRDYVSASLYRLRRAVGISPLDKTFKIQFWGALPKDKNKREKPSRRRRKSRWKTTLGPAYYLLRDLQKTSYITYDAKEIISDIIEYQPKVISANPSYLRLLAETVSNMGIENFHPKALRSSGEALDEPTRRFLESSFGCKVFDSYWSNETGCISWECKRKKGQHINVDLLALEVVRDGEPVGPGEPGEIVVTGFMNYAMPLIRYRLGDIGILDDEPCSCGRGLPLLKSVEGRAVDCFTLPDGRKVTPKTVMTAVQGTPGVSRYQAVQESSGKVVIELMRRESDPPVDVEELVARCCEVLGEGVEIEVFFGDRKNLKAKFRPVISKLTVAGEPRWTKPRTNTS